MLAVNYSTIRSKFKTYCDEATDKNEIVIITHKNEKNVFINTKEIAYKIVERLTEEQSDIVKAPY